MIGYRTTSCGSFICTFPLQRIERPLQEKEAVKPQDVVGVHLAGQERLNSGEVAERLLDVDVVLAHDDHHLARHIELVEDVDPRPGGRDVQREVLQHRDPLALRRIRERRAERQLANLPGNAEIVVARFGSEHRAAALPYRRAAAAGTGPAGALLAPWLGTASADLAPPFGGRGPRAPRGALHAHHHVHGVLVRLYPEQRVGEIDLAHGLPLYASQRYLHVHHRLPLLAIFTDSRMSTMLPRRPGTEPLTIIRLLSLSTSTTLRFRAVTLSPPILPGSFFPLKTLEGVAHCPTEPGALWNLEPCEAGPPE